MNIINRLRNISKGQEIIYHTGLIARDRVNQPGGNVIDIAGTNRIAKMAWDLHKRGRVDLFQRRITEQFYQYIARGK